MAMSCRAATNCPTVSWKGPDGSSPITKTFCRLGNTSVILAPTSTRRRARYLAQIPCIGKDPSPRQMEVGFATTGCSRLHHPSKLVSDIDGRCRGSLLCKGGAKRSHRPARWTKAASLVLCMRSLSQEYWTRVEVRRWRMYL
jgi:hypothetical protein